MAKKCEKCEEYEKKLCNFCKICGYAFKGGAVRHARRTSTKGFKGKEKFCCYCGKEELSCEC